MNETQSKIINLIDKLRPFLVNDGGNIVYVKMLGACADCALIDITLKEGIEEIITSEIPEVKEVRLFDFE